MSRLTNRQKEALRKLVEISKTGTLPEEFDIGSDASNKKEGMTVSSDGNPPIRIRELSELVVNVLIEEGYLFRGPKVDSKYVIRPAGFDAVANNFEPPKQAAAVVQPRVRTGVGRHRPPARRPGQQVDCYMLVKYLGEGHSAEVWKAQVAEVPDGVDLEQGQEVAIKLYNSITAEQTMRLHREYTIASQIEHPSVVRVHDFMFSPNRDLMFLVMELAPGKPLKDRIPSAGMNRDEVIQIGIQLFAALDEIHSHRALHRDIKAANIMVDGPSQTIKVLDFGIVGVESDFKVTQASDFLGSKHSSSPEQLKGHKLTERSDIYSAASVLFHCYMGRPMYDGAGTVAGIMHEMIRKPEVLVPKPGDEEFATFVNSCLLMEMEERPGSAKECHDQLTRMAANSFSGMMAGRWLHVWKQHDNPTYAEIASIAPDGSYARDREPTFILENFTYDRENRIIEFDKRYIPGHWEGDGNLLQRDQLVVQSDKLLVGHRKDDPQFPLWYFREEGGFDSFAEMSDGQRERLLKRFNAAAKSPKETADGVSELELHRPPANENDNA